MILSIISTIFVILVVLIQIDTLRQFDYPMLYGYVVHLIFFIMAVCTIIAIWN